MDYTFENPNKIPLHDLIVHYKNEKIPALSARWIEKKNFTRYVPLKIKENESFDEDEWLYEMKHFNQDLEWILGLNFHR
ncbi:hypothetical protein PVAND_013039 [Polypedilum vanderplanki]|uniref:Uncharacterized protein n=1 Tax=Polypedilum vanderplanki TaxID=319348 RepID=A0A9J6CPH9_POLVA|nr:hypothetical protein PVAND_013039 [Polypedilum vanderplanki]